MRLLLDSNAILLWMRAPRRIPRRTHALIEDGRNETFASVATIYELEFKERLGKLQFDLPAEWKRDVETAGFSWLTIQARHASRSASLSLIHRDPWDRVIVAQAQEENLTLVTRDERLSDYDVPILW